MRTSQGASYEAVEAATDTLLLLLAPAAPHLSEELWERRGRAYSIHQQAWPVADPALAAADLIELPVQVDGKLRDRLQVAPDTSPEEIERLAFASERVQAYLDGACPGPGGPDSGAPRQRGDHGRLTRTKHLSVRPG